MSALDLAGNINKTQNQFVEIYYCYVSSGTWSSCILGGKSRTNTNRDCSTTVETASCSTSTLSSSGITNIVNIVEEENETIEPIENETQNITLAINETILVENKTDEKNITSTFLDKLKILEKNIMNSNISETKKQELLELLEDAKQTNFLGNISDMKNVYSLLETKIMDELFQSSNDWTFEIGIVILLSVVGLIIYGVGEKIKFKSFFVKAPNSLINRKIKRKKITKYITECFSEGFSEDQIKTKLLSVGWQEKSIDLAFVDYYEKQKNK